MTTFHPETSPRQYFDMSPSSCWLPSRNHSKISFDANTRLPVPQNSFPARSLIKKSPNEWFSYKYVYPSKCTRVGHITSSSIFEVAYRNTLSYQQNHYHHHKRQCPVSKSSISSSSSESTVDSFHSELSTSPPTQSSPSLVGSSLDCQPDFAEPVQVSLLDNHYSVKNRCIHPSCAVLSPHRDYNKQGEGEQESDNDSIESLCPSYLRSVPLHTCLQQTNEAKSVVREQERAVLSPKFPYPNPLRTIGDPTFRARISKLSKLQEETARYEKNLFSFNPPKRFRRIQPHIPPSLISGDIPTNIEQLSKCISTSTQLFTDVTSISSQGKEQRQRQKSGRRSSTCTAVTRRLTSVHISSGKQPGSSHTNKSTCKVCKEQSSSVSAQPVSSIARPTSHSTRPASCTGRLGSHTGQSSSSWTKQSGSRTRQTGFHTGCLDSCTKRPASHTGQTHTGQIASSSTTDSQPQSQEADSTGGANEPSTNSSAGTATKNNREKLKTTKKDEEQKATVEDSRGPKAVMGDGKQPKSVKKGPTVVKKDCKQPKSVKKDWQQPNTVSKARDRPKAIKPVKEEQLTAIKEEDEEQQSLSSQAMESNPGTSSDNLHVNMEALSLGSKKDTKEVSKPKNTNGKGTTKSGIGGSKKKSGGPSVQRASRGNSKSSGGAAKIGGKKTSSAGSSSESATRSSSGSTTGSSPSSLLGSSSGIAKGSSSSSTTGSSSAITGSSIAPAAKSSSVPQSLVAVASSGGNARRRKKTGTTASKPPQGQRRTHSPQLQG